MHACHAGLVDVLHALCASARTSPQFGVERDLYTLASAQLPKSSSCVLGGSGAPGDVPGTAMKPLTIRSTGFCLILLFVLPGGFCVARCVSFVWHGDLCALRLWSTTDHQLLSTPA